MGPRTHTPAASTAGNTILAVLVSAAGHIQKRGVADPTEDEAPNPPLAPMISIHTDDLNRLVGDEFVPPLKNADDAGFPVTAHP